MTGAEASYYDRDGSPVGDGTMSFATKKDRKNEIRIAKLVESRWKCQLHPFGPLSPIDWYATRHGRVVSVLEAKTRSHSSTKFPTVFLNVRKWLSLLLTQNGLGVPAIFIVLFTDGAKYILVNQVEASNVRIGGCSQIVKSSSDREPVIEVPVRKMKSLSDRFAGDNGGAI